MDDDQSLLRAWSQHRDETAFTTLVRRYTPLVWSACRRRLDDAASADDASQAVFVLLARHAQRLLQRPWWGASTVADWLHRTAVRTASNSRRALTRRAYHEHQVAIDMPRTQPQAPESSDLVHASLDDALRRLSSRYREPLVMHYLAARPRPEIARELGLSEHALHKRIERGLEQLRSRLGSPAMAMLLALPAASHTVASERIPHLVGRLDRMAHEGTLTRPRAPAALKLMAAGVAIGVSALTVLGMAMHAQPGRAAAVAQSSPPHLAVAASSQRTDEVAAARERGLAFLLAHQHAQRGTWGEGSYSELAITALGIRALDTFGAGTPALLQARSRAVQALASYAREHQGHLTDLGPPAYPQALGTLALAEHMPEIPDGAVLVAQAAAILLAGQSPSGGWRYALNAQDADLSVTGDVVLALAQAQRAGACDAHAALQRAQDYLQACFISGTGNFTYSPQGQHPLPTRDMPAVHAPAPGQEETAYRTALGAWALSRIGGLPLTIERAHTALMQGWTQERSFGLICDAFASEALMDDHACRPFWAARIYPSILALQSADGSWRPVPALGQGSTVAQPVLQTIYAVLALAPSPAASGWEALTTQVVPRVYLPVPHANAIPADAPSPVQPKAPTF